MVFSAPAPGVGSSKRPASCMQDDVNGWDTVPPMGLSMRSSINIPYAHYAMIYLNNMGRLKVVESASIQEQNETVFTPEIHKRFLELLGAKIKYQLPMVQRLSAGSATPYSYKSHQPLAHLSYHQTTWGRNSTAHSMYSVPPSIQFSVPVKETPSCRSVDMVELKISNTPQVLNYYEKSLEHFQQLNCHEIAKAFIKFIEPQKQVKHPYNRGKPPAGAPPGKKGNPEMTKPEWWPPNVVHKEPDHLRKDHTYLERLSLLIHIIQKLRRFGITMDQLQEIAHNCKRRLTDPHKLLILDEVFRKERDGDSNVGPNQKHEQEDNADEALPILHSEMNSTSLMLSSVEYMGMAAPIRPKDMGDDRNQLFSLPEWLSSGETPWADQTLLPTTSEFTKDYASQQMPRTHATTAPVSPNEMHAAFDYMTQESITSSTPEQTSPHRQAPLPMQQSASFNPWAPSFQHNLFNPMVYGTAPSHAISQTTMSYQLPRSLTSHPQEMPHMAHGLPNLPQNRPSMHEHEKPFFPHRIFESSL
ncbi:hypothetical protein Asppvi_005835 [Aspergillus pseudoviridinutans]|uniref:Subtelomeric hrmA-associated cluster protein AFUB-079030/YDR124W-like helical bundle domain-containing protein n=1 Tax=Aspergillus pseudoviridinutans TaxID=1517512 RepID=A0A9P3ESX9_9EURO|nr:uncharacterized protein Asppvi_005835 [Aspergillus pseudoviridinutans]GIJ86936.1 hypothetical protein Asppvi_005835 [Aspergillus pseudoviridinutans]